MTDAELRELAFRHPKCCDDEKACIDLRLHYAIDAALAARAQLAAQAPVIETGLAFLVVDGHEDPENWWEALNTFKNALLNLRASRERGVGGE